MKEKYGVSYEPTAGPDIWEGWFDSLEDAFNYAVNRHLLWCRHWKKALYITRKSTGAQCFLVPRAQA